MHGLRRVEVSGLLLAARLKRLVREHRHLSALTRHDSQQHPSDVLGEQAGRARDATGHRQVLHHREAVMGLDPLQITHVEAQLGGVRAVLIAFQGHEAWLEEAGSFPERGVKGGDYGKLSHGGV